VAASATTPIGTGTVVPSDGANITSHDLCRDRNRDTIVEMVKLIHQTRRSGVAERRAERLDHGS
jgi:hypothetical protein